MKIARNIALTLVCILLGVMLAWQYRSVDFIQKAASENYKRLEDYKDALIQAQKRIDELTKRNNKLIEDNEIFKSASSTDSQITEKLKEELKLIKTFAGLYDVKGKGVIITLSMDSANEFSYIRDEDILLLLNELRASDAQAISVNEERIVATSEIREAGSYMMINGRQTLPPYTIKAIGDPDNMDSSLRIIEGVLEHLSLYMKVKIEKSDNITIRKVRDDGSVIRTNWLNPVIPK